MTIIKFLIRLPGPYFEDSVHHTSHVSDHTSLHSPNVWHSRLLKIFLKFWILTLIWEVIFWSPTNPKFSFFQDLVRRCGRLNKFHYSKLPQKKVFVLTYLKMYITHKWLKFWYDDVPDSRWDPKQIFSAIYPFFAFLYSSKNLRDESKKQEKSCFAEFHQEVLIKCQVSCNNYRF